MKKFLNYSFVLTLFLSLTSCLSYKEVQVQEVQSVRVLNINEQTADVEVTLKINNPNRMRIVVKDYDLQAYINKKPVGKVNFDKKFLIPKKSQNSYTMVVRADMTQVKKLIPSLMFSNKALLNISGDVKVKAKGISKKFHIDHEEKISRNDLKNIMTARN